MKEKVIISACLLGIDCRYDGKNNRLPAETLRALNEKYCLIPVCPECFGGMSTPRTPSERVGDRVLSRDGDDVTRQFESGAEAAVLLARQSGAKLAILKENSPSCGSGGIYDGSFSGRIIPGKGVTGEMLAAAGLHTVSENGVGELI